MSKKVLITGAKGFIARNLITHLQCLYNDLEIFLYSRESSDDDLRSYILRCDFIFHLAGENRPLDNAGYVEGNVCLTRKLCEYTQELNPVPILFTSSVQAENDSPYGSSKLQAELALRKYSLLTGQPVYIYRLPNVFGKWSRPNYNSFVATICYNTSHGISLDVDDREKTLALVYIDDVISAFVRGFNEVNSGAEIREFQKVDPIHYKKLGYIIDLVQSFNHMTINLKVPYDKDGFTKSLYATFLSHIPNEKFVYDISSYSDDRGSFYEVIKTLYSGQISISTTSVGVTRGDHFHHTKCEKFMVLKGKAHFTFKQLHTNEKHDVITDDSKKQIVEVPPGYTHNFTNIGKEELIMLLWASEVFNKDKPDTYILEAS